MIKRLRRKFVLIAMGSLLVVLAVLLGAINTVNFLQLDRRAQGLLSILAENDGQFPDLDRESHRRPPGERDLPLTPETRFQTRYFSAWADENGTITQVDTGHIAAVSAQEAREYAQELLASGRTTGYRGIYRYLAAERDGETLLLFLDCHSELQTALSLLAGSCLVALGSFAVVFLLVSLLSRRAVRPVLENMERQRRFITDAGHELKTPLAILSANADVLELETGKSQWIDSIRHQVARLSHLVQDLLFLARMEEGARRELADFDLSEAVQSTAAPFEALARTAGLDFVLDIPPALRYTGDEERLRELTSILVDNAVKYACAPGAVKVTLEQRGRGVRLSVYNTCPQPPQGDLDRLFDRFYRADESRSRETGGCGIGLSLAKAIVEAHRGKLTAQRQESPPAMVFTAVL